ncbi:hypothetical protein KXX35_003395, partial [Aspergillus fumigatus]
LRPPRHAQAIEETFHPWAGGPLPGYTGDAAGMPQLNLAQFEKVGIYLNIISRQAEEFRQLLYK